MAEIFECGVHERWQYAQNATGQWFRRYQFKSRFGFKWTPWKTVAAKPEKATSNSYAGKARLPW